MNSVVSGEQRTLVGRKTALATLVAETPGGHKQGPDFMFLSTVVFLSLLLLYYSFFLLFLIFSGKIETLGVDRRASRMVESPG